MAKEKVLSEAELRRKYSNSNKADIILPADNVIRLPSRILPFNSQIGGGPPYGRSMELFGWESTGKSLLAMELGYSTQYLGGQVLWADMENSWANNWAEQCELDTSEIELLDGDNAIEHFSDWSKDMVLHYRSKLTNNEPILLVCDSIAAGETLANLEAGDQSSAKAEMGNRAKAWDKMYRLRIPLFKKYGVIVVMINQLRGRIGATMFEAAETTPGGKATGFYSSIRVALIRGKQIKGRIGRDGYVDDIKGEKCGSNVTIQVKKNKTFPPRDSVKTEVYFTPLKQGYIGYNKYLGLDQMALDANIITKKGNTYSVKGKTIAGKKSEVMESIEDNHKLRKYLIKKLGINTLSRTEEKIQSFDRNLFKVKTSKDE